jgi:membrane protein DedA with SNARE-associated domain
MDYVLDFVRNWGYWAIFLGSLIEGESIILTASGLAAFGYFDIQKVMLTAFFGTLLADQALYYLGYFRGHAIFERFPSLRKGADKAFVMLHKYDIWFILSCRFIYGIRVVSSIVIGAAHVKPVRFSILNVIAAIIWTVVSCMGGYLLGDVMEEWIKNFESGQKVLIALVVLFLSIPLLFTLYKKIKKKPSE